MTEMFVRQKQYKKTHKTIHIYKEHKISLHMR